MIKLECKNFWQSFIIFLQSFGNILLLIYHINFLTLLYRSMVQAVTFATKFSHN